MQKWLASLEFPYQACKNMWKNEPNNFDLIKTLFLEIKRGFKDADAEVKRMRALIDPSNAQGEALKVPFRKWVDFIRPLAPDSFGIEEDEVNRQIFIKQQEALVKSYEKLHTFFQTDSKLAKTAKFMFKNQADHTGRLKKKDVYQLIAKLFHNSQVSPPPKRVITQMLARIDDDDNDTIDLEEWKTFLKLFATNVDESLTEEQRKMDSLTQQHRSIETWLKNENQVCDTVAQHAWRREREDRERKRKNCWHDFACL